MHHAQPGAVRFRLQGPGNGAIQRRGIAPAPPRIDQTAMGHDFQHLAAHDAAQSPFGWVVKVKCLPTTAAKSLGISQRPMISAVVSAFHTLSGEWGKKSSATMSRVAPALAAAGRRAGL